MNVSPGARVLMLDVDGVLNTHRPHPNRFCGMDAVRLDRLERVVEQTGCEIVLASAWRYMVLEGSMNLKGFANLMSTHGAGPRTCAALKDRLPPDLDWHDPVDRGRNAWGFMQNHPDALTCVAVDDGDSRGGDMGWTHFGFPLVKTGRHDGLLEADVLELVRLLTDPRPANRWKGAF